jgi:hypothetical protein
LIDNYYIPEEVAAWFTIMGVAVFLRIDEEAIAGLIRSDNGSSINVTMVLAARKDMARLLEEGSNVAVPAVQQVPAGGVVQAPVVAAEPAAAAVAAAASALRDLYLEDEDEEGKLVIIANFGVVGGLDGLQQNADQY